VEKITNNMNQRAILKKYEELELGSAMNYANGMELVKLTNGDQEKYKELFSPDEPDRIFHAFRHERPETFKQLGVEEGEIFQPQFDPSILRFEEGKCFIGYIQVKETLSSLEQMSLKMYPIGSHNMQKINHYVDHGRREGLPMFRHILDDVERHLKEKFGFEYEQLKNTHYRGEYGPINNTFVEYQWASFPGQSKPKTGEFSLLDENLQKSDRDALFPLLPQDDKEKMFKNVRHGIKRDGGIFVLPQKGNNTMTKELQEFYSDIEVEKVQDSYYYFIKGGDLSGSKEYKRFENAIKCNGKVCFNVAKESTILVDFMKSKYPNHQLDEVKNLLFVEDPNSRPKLKVVAQSSNANDIMKILNRLRRK